MVEEGVGRRRKRNEEDLKNEDHELSAWLHTDRSINPTAKRSGFSRQMRCVRSLFVRQSDLAYMSETNLGRPTVFPTEK